MSACSQHSCTKHTHDLHAKASSKQGPSNKWKKLERNLRRQSGTQGSHRRSSPLQNDLKGTQERLTGRPTKILMPSASHALPGLEGCNIGEAAEAGPESAQILTMRQRLMLLSPG